MPAATTSEAESARRDKIAATLRGRKKTAAHRQAIGRGVEDAARRRDVARMKLARGLEE